MAWQRPSLVLDGVEYYTTVKVAKIIGRSRQTVLLWYSYSQEEEKAGRPPFIPSPVIYKNKFLWSRSSVQEIIKFKDKVQYGFLSKYSRALWQKRGRDIRIDGSIESRSKRKQVAELVDLQAEKLQREGASLVRKKGRQILDSNLEQAAKSVFEDIPNIIDVKGAFFNVDEGSNTSIRVSENDRNDGVKECEEGITGEAEG